VDRYECTVCGFTYDDVHELGIGDLCATNSENAHHTGIQHAALFERQI